LLFFSSEPI